MPDADNNVSYQTGHVLFIDIVGYSRLLHEEQKERLDQLTGIVLATEQVRESTDEQLVRLPTGDGMALVFRQSAEEPARCALEIAEALRKHPELPVRMGIHSGPVSEVTDVSGRTNLAGAGINMAQRVMDCGDAGHILVSQHVADDLMPLRQWAPRLHDLGQCEVKHGVRLHLANLFAEPLGNAAVPQKFQQAKPEAIPAKPARSKAGLIAALVFMALLAAGAVLWWQRAQRTSPPPVPAVASAPTPGAPMASAAPEKSVAVLPFENLSSDKENAYFADGVQDEILTNLAKIADLKVISRTSVMQYKTDAPRNLREIGRQLGVAHLLEGSVQRAGGKVRVNAQLIDARTDAHQWAENYDRDLADVFAIQSEIAKAIAEQLQAKLSSKEDAVVTAKPTKDMVAYDLFLKALEIDRNRVSSGGTGGAEGAKREVELLAQAVARDPEFVPALCVLANIHLYLHWLNDGSAPHVDLAKKALEAAARLQPDSGDVHFTRGLFYYRASLDYEPALAEFALAARSLPNDAYASFMIAMVKRRQGRWDESIQHTKEALALDPRNASFIPELATTYFIVHRYEEAAETLDRSLAWKRDDFPVALLRAFVEMAWNGDLRPWKAVAAGDFGRPSDPSDLISARLVLALLERNYHAAQEALDTPGLAEFDDNGFFIPREWSQGIVARGLRDKARAKAAFQAARQRAAAAVQEAPTDARALIVLGQIDAALGRTADAVREGEHASELLPPTKDAINGGFIQEKLARIYAQAGDRTRALTYLEGIRQMPNGPTYGSLKLEEDWDALRGDPRFEKLVASLAPNEAKAK